MSPLIRSKTKGIKHRDKQQLFQDDNPLSLNIWIKTPTLLLAVLSVLASLPLACAQSELINVNGHLDGIGYREQELQIAKGTVFASESPTGVRDVSFAGATHIFIQGVGLHDNPQSNSVILYSEKYGADITSLPLSEDDAFNSHPLMGKIAYRLPSIEDLFNLPISHFYEENSLTFTLKIKNMDPELGMVTLACLDPRNCEVTYKKEATASVYYIQPPVVYYESFTEVHFNPMGIMKLIQDLDSDEYPFINVKLGGSLIDFEFNVDDTTFFANHLSNHATGQIGELPPGSNYNISMMWETGQAYIEPVTATHCSYDNQTCYQARAVPVIFGLSSNEGYHSGGMNLTVKGYGFTNGQIQATVDGKNCAVTSVYEESFSCQVEAKDAVSDTGLFVGSNGVRRRFRSKVGMVYTGIDNYEITNETLSLQMEVPKDVGSQLANVMKGWFIPPATTRYRFYIACDDMCHLNLGSTPNSIDDVTEIAQAKSGTPRRVWNQTKDGKNWPTSEWISLNEGEPHFIEGVHWEGGGNDYFTAAVEIENNELPGHHHSMKEQQVVSIGTDIIYDTIRITITDFDDGQFMIVWKNGNDMSTQGSGLMTANADLHQGEMWNQIQWYFNQNQYVKSGIDIFKKMYDADGVETEDKTLAVSSTYEIVCLKLLNTPSIISATVVKTTTAASITVETPDQVQLSSPPLNGKWRIKCIIDDEGNFQYTEDMRLDWGAWQIEARIQQDCYGFENKVKVERLHGDYWQNGIEFLIKFPGVNSDVGQFEAVSSVDDPITGLNVVYTAETPVPYGQNLFYEPIPFEFLRTFEEKPQMIVTVGDDPAVCHNLTCDFTFIEPVGEITSFTFTESTKKLVMQGTNLPGDLDRFDRIEFAQQECIVDEHTISDTMIECTMFYGEPTCGDFKPILVSSLGQIPVASSVAAQTIDCSVTQASPTLNLNLLGGDFIEIEGNYFPSYLSESTVSIKFSDAQETECVVYSSWTTQIKCKTQPFDKAIGSQTLSMTIVINGQVVTNSLSFTLKVDAKRFLSITPESASPVLKTKITVALSEDWTHTLTRESLSMNATSVTNSSYIRQMNVIEVDNAARTFVVMFGGAESGQFYLNIRHSEYGLIDTDDIILEVGAQVTSYSPMQGSIYGGTLLTISGNNFGDVYTDNPVQISRNGALGSVDCFVLETSATEIKCRIDTGLEKTGGDTDLLIVFLKASEEADCEPRSTCEFTWTSHIPDVTQVDLQFSGTEWQLVATGTDFTGDIDSVELQIFDVAQTTSSVSTTEAVFSIVDVSTQTLEAQKLFFDVGVPNGHSFVEATFELTPKLVSISPVSGSIGGSLLTAIVPGATVSSILDIVDQTGATICDKITIESYGVVQCKTIAGEMTSTQLSIKQDSNTYDCANSDTSQCQYEQLASSAFPTVTEVSKTDDTLVFTGTGFDLADFAVSAEFAGVTADVIAVDSSTQATATFTLGVPVVFQDEFPTLLFTKDALVHFAPALVALENAVSVTSSSTEAQCSFAGNCLYEVTSSGLASVLKSDSTQNYIEVCNEKCIFDEATSTSTVAKCKVPKISTIYSNENFEISLPSENLKGNMFGTAEDYEIAFDDKMLVKPTDTNSECHLGMSFKEGHVAVLSQVKYFLKDILTHKEIYVNVTTFQGSDDGITYTDIFQMDDNVHEGWNYFNWEELTEQPRFRFYRFYADQVGACAINEITFTGIETIDSEEPTHSCSIKLFTGEIETSLNPIEYVGSLTPSLTAVNPRFGSVEGGTEITFTGEQFSSDTNLYTIIIDGINCPVSAATTTSVTCTTGSRPGLVETSLEIYIEGYGLVSNRGIVFRYASFWSADSTWGGEFAPMHMESIHIPKGLNLLVDVDSTPELMAVIVEGSLIFAPDADPNHHRSFDAHYVFVNGGVMEVGTVEFPYTSKITITMYGTVTDPYLPIYGNKVIGVRLGTLDMHGPVRTPTWTELEYTVEPGADTITVRSEVDWQVGEQIVVATTSFDPRGGEKRTIKAIDSTKKIITLDQKLNNKHFAETQYFGDDPEDFIDMRAEVGLISRNVVYRGDPETTSMNQYGATIFLHSSGDDSLTARLSYIEMTDVGQAFKVGRYAVHFHMIGAVHTSYAKGCATHQGFNRAFTIHGTHYLRLLDNVVYDVKGHNIFIEDAIETNNIIKGNLVMGTKRSMSLLNTDQTPACYWITHPFNHFYDNHAAGSDRYGFWYDLQDHAIGPSADMNVCPCNSQVGEFINNTAHSVGRYGLRIFHNMVPRKFPCKEIKYDSSVPENPYWQNPPITANFYNYTGWKNNRAGAILEKVGDVKLHGFKTADNLQIGIEFSQLEGYFRGYPTINGALMAGKTSNTEELLDGASPRGVMTPRQDGLTVSNVKFYNYDWNDAAAVSTCSHCFHSGSTDSGARTTHFNQIYYDSATVPRKIRYQPPLKAILHDEDGTLLGRGPDAFASYYYEHHNQPECENSQEEFGGIVCDPTVQIRRIAFWDSLPGRLFETMGLFFLRYDDEMFANDAEKQAYIDDKDNYGTIPFKAKHTPADGWAVPIVTGHKYKMHWGQTGLDFEYMFGDTSRSWEHSDKSLYLVHNFTDVRDDIQVHVNNNRIPNNSIPENPDDYMMGQNIVYPDTATRELHFIINGKLKDGALNRTQFNFTSVRCEGQCQEDIIEVEEEEVIPEYFLWSDPDTWPSGEVPKEGEDVTIDSILKVILDVDTPVLGRLDINGKLYFSDESDIHLQANKIYVRAGELHIGNETHPYQHNALITLHGFKNDEHLAFDSAIEGGNKLIANTNLVKMYGKQRTDKMSRLRQEAKKGDTEILISSGLDLVPGDRIVLVATSFNFNGTEELFVKTYDIETGKITLESPVRIYHWGAPESTAEKYNGVDIRGEVLFLSRNIKIQGTDVETWGCQTVTSDTIEYDMASQSLKYRYGQMFLDNVEFYNCSQIDTFKTAVRFEGAVQKHSSLTNCTFHNGHGYGMNVRQSSNIYMSDNIWYNFVAIGVTINYGNNVTLDNSVVVHTNERTTQDGGAKGIDKACGICVCTLFHPGEICSEITITNNIAAGLYYSGFTVRGEDCDYTGETPMFYNNVAHSIGGVSMGHGAIIYPIPEGYGGLSQKECFQGSHFAAYKCYMQGAFSYFKTNEVRLHHMTMIDNRQGFGAGLGAGSMDDRNQGDGYDYDEQNIIISDNKFYGESEIPDCPEDGSFCFEYDKYAFMFTGGTHSGNGLHVTGSHTLPVQKVKSLANWNTKQKHYRNEFFYFDTKTRMGMRQDLFELNQYAADYHPMAEFWDTKFTDVGSVAYIDHPNPDWANLMDCGNFPCSAPLNILISFQDSKFYGKKPRWATSDFQVIANNTGFAPYVVGCEPEEISNAYICEASKLGVMLFESNDYDKMDRSMQPIYVKRQGTEMENKLNAMMDHVWDGFYTGQKRLQRFPTVIQGDRGSIYDLNFTGTPAKNMRFTYRSQSKTAGTTIRIAYPSAESRQILVDGKPVEFNQWDESINNYGAIKQRYCGENRYLGVVNILEFYLNTDCDLQIKPRNAIQTLVRMEWSFEEFFAEGGTTAFIDRITASLGIHASTVKVVSVYEGSLIINYEITADDDDEETLAQIQQQQDEMFSAGTMNLGAPILAYEAAIQIDTSTSSSYTPVVINSPDYVQQVNQNDPSVFNPDLDILTEQEITYINSTVQVSLEPETKTVTQTIVVDSEPEIISTKPAAEKSKTGLLIVSIALSIVIIFALILVARCLLFRQFQSKLQTEDQVKKIHARKIEMKQSVRASVNSINFNTQSKIVDNSMNPDESEDHEPQYDPNTDFAIFGIGNHRVGGVQNMQEKMNMADHKGAESSSSEEEESKREYIDQKQSTEEPSSGSGVKIGETSDDQGGKLPEDQEIHEIDEI